MPGLVIDSSFSSQNSHEDGLGLDPGSSIRYDYPAASFPGYAEQPLENQLEPIAVVGMGCRLPGAVGSPAEFWDMMINKRTGQTPKVPASRFNIDAHYHQNNERPGSFSVLGGYFLQEELSDFDPGLFGITPIETMWMDPQQRKLLEVVYEALESGGITLDTISGTKTAVFAATFTADWQQMAFKEHSFRHSLAATGVDPGILSNRISHVFNLTGPSIVCNTACSSSVYALHNACNALRNREAEGAIVGGVNLIITVDQHMNTAKLGVLSPTSTCHTFDKNADGYGRADAVGAVYLKRLSDAIRDGDPIRGVIRSTAVNSNGKVPAVGITHPNRQGQAEVISDAYQRGGDLDPRLTGYFECHGTGTAVGDPLEVHAVSISMNKERKPGENPLWIGAVKTNIGHSEAASGLSALIKAILTVERGVIPPIKALVEPNPDIKWQKWQVKVPTEPVPFPSHLPVRRVSVNSFGYGGTNAHIIVEGADSLVSPDQKQGYIYSDISVNKQQKYLGPRRAASRSRPFLLPFSAHDKPTLLRNIDAHAKVVGKYPLLDLSYTLSNRRSVLSYRGFTVASHKILEGVFNDVATSFKFTDSKKRTKTPTIGFVFTGQGAQWARMGAALINYSSMFLASIRMLDSALEEIVDGPMWSIEDVLLEPEETSRINEAEFSQPVCTAVQIALVQLLNYWGIRATVTVGHSSGEMAAAFAAGLISAREAITLAYYRGAVTSSVRTSGAMMAIGLGAEEAASYIDQVDDKVVVACHNSPSGVTLSGDLEAIEKVKVKLDAEGVFARVVKTKGKAYHSHHMAPASATYEKLVQAAKEHKPFDPPTPTTTRMVSSVTNRVIPDMTVLDEKYWSNNLRSPVLFNQAVQTILTSDNFKDVDVLIEVGPHSAMSGPIKQIKTKLGREQLEYFPTLLRGTDCAIQLLNLAGELFLLGYPLDMERVAAAYVEESPSGASKTSKIQPTKGSIIVDLPPYQWNYTREFWAESRSSREQRQPKYPRHDVLGQRVIGSSMSEPTWRNILRIRDLPWLSDHNLGGEVVFPAAGYFAMAIEAATQLDELSDAPVNIESYVLRDVTIQKALVVPDGDDGIEVLLNIRPSVYGSRWWDFGVSSIDENDVKKDHMVGTIGINNKKQHSPRKIPQFPQRVTGSAWNQALRDVGFDYGWTFKDMDDICFDGKHYEASCTTNIKQQVDESLGESRYVLHPASVDSLLQLSIVAIYAGRTKAMDYGVIPIQLDEVIIWTPSQEQVRTTKANAYAWVDQRGIRSFESSGQLTAHDGTLIMEIVNLRGVSYEAAVTQKAASVLEESPYSQIRWEIDFNSIDTASDIDGLTATDLVNLVLFKSPANKILQLGLPTEQNVKKIFDSNPLAPYTVAVASDVEIDAAKKMLEGYQSAKVFELDLAQDSASESTSTESYDIAVPNESIQIASASKFLKTSGYLITPEGVDSTYLATDFDIIAKGNTGPTIYKLSNQETTNGHASISVEKQHSVQLIYRTSQAPILLPVKSALEALGWSVGVSSLKNCSQLSIAEHVIMLADFEGPLIFTINDEEFAMAQKIINTASSLLWVTAGGLLDGKQPEFAMVPGLARTITSERATIDFRTIDIDEESVTLEQTVSSIVKVAHQQSVLSEKAPERELRLANGKTHISRLTRHDNLNSRFSTSQIPEPKKFLPGDRIFGKVIKGKVVFQPEITIGQEDIKPGHVQVEVQASGLTKEGVLVIAGSDYPTTFSYEIGGIVKKVGQGVKTLQSGDRVVGFNADRFASYQEVPESMLYKIQEGEDINTAVGALTAYAAALYGLETLAATKASEYILILNGTGLSGIAAIKVAQAKKAVPYVVVDSNDEADFIEKHALLDRRQIILSNSTNYSIFDKLQELTNGHAVDVVFGSGVSYQDIAHEAWRCISRFGRFVDGGRKDVLQRKALDAVPLNQRGASYLSFDILDLYRSRPQVLAGFLPVILSMLREGQAVVPGPIQQVNMADLDEAFTRFSDAFGAPKSIIAYENYEKSIQLLLTRPRYQFNPNSTYLLVGCLGGLGRSLTSWMMGSGAKRFIFLSRSGTDTPSAAQLVRKLEQEGAVVQVVRGDATSRADVVRATKQASFEYPIRGVIHAAMVLQDGLFESMTFDNWKTSVEPKILGASNLHSVLANEPLDFFLMTGSVSGILGNSTQSNYAAANTYLDSLARHRHVAKKCAVSVVLPMILGVGVVAENTELEHALKRKGMYGIDEEALIEAFEAALTSSVGSEEGASDHVVMGLDPVELRKAVNDPVATDSFWVEDSRFSHVVHQMNGSLSTAIDGEAGQQSILATIKASASLAQAVAAVTEHFIGKLVRMLLLDKDVFEPDTKSIASYGIDSMIGAELRNWIFKEYRIDIPFQQLLGPTLTITKFATQICASQGLEA